MDLAVNHFRRITVLAAGLVLLAATVTISADRADAAAPAPTDFILSLTANSAGECVGELSWTEGKGQIYVQMTIVKGTALQASFASKVSTAGDPRGSKAMTHTFSLPNGPEDGQMLDINIKTAKGKGGAFGDQIAWVSMIGGDETVTCG